MREGDHWLWSAGLAGVSVPLADTVDCRLSEAGQSAAAEELRVARRLVRRLATTNVRSVQIAKDLLLAQQLADLHNAKVEPAIDAAAGSGGDPAAIDRAVEMVSVAERAEEQEFAISREWATHCGEVFSLVEVANRLLAGGGHPVLDGHVLPNE